jgi:hypothetical protein
MILMHMLLVPLSDFASPSEEEKDASSSENRKGRLVHHLLPIPSSGAYETTPVRQLAER